MHVDADSLTDELRQKIVSAIRGGVYPHVAAGAYGVPRDVFDAWLAREEEPFATFARDVASAHGQARARAELEVFQKDPKNWLMNGPGREQEDTPGWSQPVRAAGQSLGLADILNHPAVIALICRILESLTSLPEARGIAERAAGATIAELQRQERSTSHSTQALQEIDHVAPHSRDHV